ncbi:helix-hairpin-helix domain-containing protein [Bailinhaonella thermotolerans]|uniref:DNA-binding protein n=1 Tax=Bailinhaonella thermotolerans TaxID=1070861 RepID=A0A3A4B8X6_9ACTN|nr:helix-hairpin-helix domain-containing protein [Bailinhaonella thermotolerans]RJL34661.1 DNA-binding protein [Bailinhaonella thermotolerans]
MGGNDVAEEGAWPDGMGAPARGALIAAGYTRFEELAGADPRELLRIHGVGPKALRRLREALAEKGLRFAGE